MEFQPHSLKQDLALFSEKRFTVAATGIQWGKGLDLDCSVLTDHGYKKAREIKKGEILFDRDGNPTKVTGVFPQGIKSCFEMRFTDGKSFITDDSHLNVVIKRENRPERIMTTAHIFREKHLYNSRAKARFPSSAPIQMSKKQIPFHPYILGVLLGDGALNNGSVKLSNPDREIIDKVSQLLDVQFEIKQVKNCEIEYLLSSKTKSKIGKDGRYLAGCNSILAWFRDNDLDVKSHEKFVPDVFKYSNIDDRVWLLRGLMDTDGWVINKGKNASGRCIRFLSTSKRLADDVVWLVESLGGKAWICKERLGKYKKNGVTHVCRPTYEVNIISPYFNPFYLSRKANKYFVHENTTNKVLCAVNPVDPRETICFSVDSPSKTFIAQGQIVTHNSELGAVRSIIKISQYTDPKDRFIITAPTFKIMDQATLPTFMERVTPLKIGQYRKGDREFQTKWGSKVLFRTGHIPDSVVGIRQTRHIWGDEAGLYSLYFWENLQGRAAPFLADITLTTSPYSLNWIFKELIKPALDGTRDDILLVQAASNENPYFPQAEFEARKKTMDPRRFQMMFGGRFERPEGMVYKCFSQSNECTDDEIPRNLEFYAGIDWGYTEPFAMTVFGIDWDTEIRYVIAEHKQSGMSLSDIKLLVEQTASQYNVRLFCCGPERPEMIDELCLIPGVAAIKGFNECRMGIDLVYDLMARGKIKFLKGRTRHHLDELEAYHYPEHIESRPDKKILDQLPVQVNDHNMDSMRYGIATTIDMRGQAPFVPGGQREFGQSNYMRIKSLLNSKRNLYSGL